MRADKNWAQRAFREGTKRENINNFKRGHKEGKKRAQRKH